VADEIKAVLGLETELISGKRGEFTVRVGDRVVADKASGGFPRPSDVVELVREALN
jgi:predicted Rdx family selenoprotein